MQCSLVHKICRLHLQLRENGQCHVFGSDCPYSKIGVIRTVQNSHAPGTGLIR